MMNSPLPAEILAWRQAHGLSARGAAELVHTTTRVWQQWETPPDQRRPDGSTDHRRMHPAMWDLARIMAAACQGDWDRVHAILIERHEVLMSRSTAPR